MSERVAGDFLAALFHVFDDFANARTFAEEDADAAVLVHHLLKAGAFGDEVELKFRNPNRVDVALALTIVRQGRRWEFLLAQHLTVLGRGSGRRVSAGGTTKRSKFGNQEPMLDL